MLKSVKRYVRDRFERKVISKPEKVENIKKQRPVRYSKYKSSFVPSYFKSVNQQFSSQFAALRHSTEQRHNDSSDKFKTTRCLDSHWIETVGLSGTLAFGWSLSQNIELKRKRLVEEIVSLHYSKTYPLKTVLCPYIAFKCVLPKHVHTQPHEFLRSKLNETKTEIPLPVFGPLTAEEALSEAKMGLEKVRNTAIAEFENRMGLRCMSKGRYRRAMVHFAAGSALQNESAMFNLAQCYELGLGAPKDLAKAAKCYRASSERGHAIATFNLAIFYAQGLGGLKCDVKKARELLGKAVELGEPHAKMVLENRFKREETLQNEPDMKNSESQMSVLKEPAMGKTVAPFPQIEVGQVTETSSPQSVALLTKKCAHELHGSIIVNNRSEKNLSCEFSPLDVKDYTGITHKLPIDFDEPVMSLKEFSCGIPLVMQFSTRTVSTVQGQ